MALVKRRRRWPLLNESEKSQCCFFVCFAIIAQCHELTGISKSRVLLTLVESIYFYLSSRAFCIFMDVFQKDMTKV